MRIGNLRGGGRVVKTLLGFCLCCWHRPQPAPTRHPWLGERLFRTSCAKTAAHHTKSKAVSKLHLNLHSDSLSAQATPPHHQKTPISLSTVLQHSPTTTPAREQRDQRGKVKTPRGGGLSVVVWFNWKPCEDAGT